MYTHMYVIITTTINSIPKAYYREAKGVLFYVLSVKGMFLAVVSSRHEHTVIFHNFKSQNFKLSVSNPANKHVAYLSVLSQISNCQGLGRKNKHAILKAYRTEVISCERYLCMYAHKLLK